MKPTEALKAIRRRIRQFKRFGYDLRASRKYILRKSEIRQGRVLEVGSGKGYLTACLARRLRIVSVDLDSQVLRSAKAYLRSLGLDRRAAFRKMDAEKLRYGPRSFDHVISVDFFHHARRPFCCLREMMRVAEKTLTIADLNQKGMHLMDRVHRAEGRRHEGRKAPFGGIKRRLGQNGFQVKSYQHEGHQIFVAQRRSS